MTLDLATIRARCRRHYRHPLGAMPAPTLRLEYDRVGSVESLTVTAETSRIKEAMAAIAWIGIGRSRANELEASNLPICPRCHLQFTVDQCPDCELATAPHPTYVPETEGRVTLGPEWKAETDRPDDWSEVIRVAEAKTESLYDLLAKAQAAANRVEIEVLADQSVGVSPPPEAKTNASLADPPTFRPFLHNVAVGDQLHSSLGNLVVTKVDGDEVTCDWADDDKPEGTPN